MKARKAPSPFQYVMSIYGNGLNRSPSRASCRQPIPHVGLTSVVIAAPDLGRVAVALPDGVAALTPAVGEWLIGWSGPRGRAGIADGIVGHGVVWFLLQ